MDKVVTSKTAWQYWLRIPILISSISFFALSVIARRDDGKNPELAFFTDRLVFFFLTFTVVVVIVLGFLLKPQKITVSSYGILMHGSIIKHQLLITRDNTQKIYVTRNGKSGSRTLCIDVKDGKEARISESSYMNFESLKYAINEYLEYIHSNSETAS